jgi:hypothetical protein
LSSLFLPLRQVAPPAKKFVDERPLLMEMSPIEMSLPLPSSLVGDSNGKKEGGRSWLGLAWMGGGRMKAAAAAAAIGQSSQTLIWL